MLGEDDGAAGPVDPTSLPSQGKYQLPEVTKGRMLCTSHGQICYRRISYTGEKEWICPDERHRRPIQDT